MKKRLNIEGMSCMHCVMHVQNALKVINGVTGVNVDLKGKYAIIELERDINDKLLKTAIEEAGYEITKIENL